MEENKNKTNGPEVIDLCVVFRKIWSNRKLFYKILPIVLVLSCIYVFSLPRYYISDIKLAPEIENSGTGGSLGALASSFGFDLSEMQTSDAITPLLYPDLMEDNGFVSGLMNIHVKSQDGEINTTYHDYLKLYQKYPWWTYPISWLKSLLPKKEDKGGGEGMYDPYNLPKKESDILSAARGKIGIAIDKKTGVISIAVEAQDPLVCKIMADSVKEKLQVFITEYRTNKARNDYEYYKKLVADAKQDYEKTRRYYASLADASTNIRLRSVELKMEDVENDMQLKLNAYTTVNTQLQAAKAKVQEKTPAFTMIKGSAVPVKHAGPKRMIFIVIILIFAIICLSLYSLKDLIIKE